MGYKTNRARAAAAADQTPPYEQWKSRYPQVLLMREQGCTLSEIAIRWSVSASTIDGVLRAYGAPEHLLERPKAERIKRYCACCLKQFYAKSRFITRCDPCKKGNN